jgi:glycosyltransferase involved in cell wall biosynthesis
MATSWSNKKRAIDGLTLWERGRISALRKVKGIRDHYRRPRSSNPLARRVQSAKPMSSGLRARDLAPLSDIKSKKSMQASERSSSSVRVLFLGHTAKLGGGEIALLNLVRQLDRQKVEPVVLLGADGPLADRLRRYAETHVLPLASNVSGARKDSLGIKSLLCVREIFELMAYIRQLSQFIVANHIDVVHTNSLKADIMGGLAGRLSSRPVVWHVRDRIADDYLPKLVVRVFRGLCKILPSYVVANSYATLGTLHLPRPKSHLPLLKSRLPKSEDTSVADKRETSARVRYAVVHDGTDIQTTSHHPIHHKSRDTKLFRIGLIGRISPWKGQHVFLQAAALVHKYFPDARFVIIGSALFGEDKYEADVRRLPGELGIEGVVSFSGFVSDVQSAIANLDLIVHASTSGEPFGQVIIEGMAMGKPVVATNGGGVPEIVEDGNTGILVPMGDAAAMADAICELADDPARARAMGRRGKRRVQEHFTLEQVARKIEAVYQFLCAGSPAIEADVAPVHIAAPVHIG